MELIDISVPVRPGMVTYPGDPPVILERVRSIVDGKGHNLSRLDLGLHSGTHVDAPLHFVDGGAAAEALPLEVLIGPAHVVEIAGASAAIDAAALESLPRAAERILLKTRNSELWERDSFVEDYASLSADGAGLLVERGVRLVGIDYLSIGDEAAHRTLLGAGVVAVEGLDLRGVEPGEYTLVCAPLKLVGAEGAPARVLLIRP
jgi:arylformamidase